MAAFIDITDQQFGDLVALKYVGHRRWLVKCLCGELNCRKRFTVLSTSLRSGNTKSCGARRYAAMARSRQPGLMAFSTISASLRRRARLAQIRWELTNDQIRQLIFAPCYHCGAPPSQSWSNHYRDGVQDTILCSGIDRLSSDEGYTWENSVPCCKWCNWGKNSQTELEFFTYCRKVTFQGAKLGMYTKEELRPFYEFLKDMFEPRPAHNLGSQEVLDHMVTTEPS